MNTPRKPVQVKIPSMKTHGFREQMRIGAAIAGQLDIVMPLGEAAKRLEMSETYVRRIECRALYKIAIRMKQLDLNAL